MRKPQASITGTLKIGSKELKVLRVASPLARLIPGSPFHTEKTGDPEEAWLVETDGTHTLSRAGVATLPELGSLFCRVEIGALTHGGQNVDGFVDYLPPCPFSWKSQKCQDLPMWSGRTCGYHIASWM